MKNNMGKTDKIIRILVAVIIGILHYVGVISGTIGLILLALAIVFLLTSFIGFCPIYTLLGINTCKR